MSKPMRYKVKCAKCGRFRDKIYIRKRMNQFICKNITVCEQLMRKNEKSQKI